jgi:hypothetical protein
LCFWSHRLLADATVGSRDKWKPAAGSWQDPFRDHFLLWVLLLKPKGSQWIKTLQGLFPTPPDEPSAGGGGVLRSCRRMALAAFGFWPRSPTTHPGLLTAGPSLGPRGVRCECFMRCLSQRYNGTAVQRFDLSAATRHLTNLPDERTARFSASSPKSMQQRRSRENESTGPVRLRFTLAALARNLEAVLPRVPRPSPPLGAAGAATSEEEHGPA